MAASPAFTLIFVSNVRIIKFDLESGVEEVLLTNLFDESITVGDFKKLYFMRWGIEIKYDRTCS